MLANPDASGLLSSDGSCKLQVHLQINCLYKRQCDLIVLKNFIKKNNFKFKNFQKKF